MPGKRTYLKIKSGLFLDPTHREKMGPRVWLFMYILDQANWQTGTVDFWTDGDAAEKLQLPKRTVKDQRQGLENAGYISCLVKGHGQAITIFNYLNPRTGEILNVKSTGESFIEVEEEPADWDTKVSQLPENRDIKVSQGGDFVPGWDTPAQKGDSPGVPRSYTSDLTITKEFSIKGDHEIEDAIQFALGELRRQGINKADYDAYLQPLKLKSFDSDSVVLTIGNRYALDLIKARYFSQLQAAVSGHFGKSIILKIETA